MLDRIEEIDTGAIEELGRLRRDQEVLEQRLSLMQERREGVSEAVYERVREDYRRRLDELEEQALPHKERARQEFYRLRALQEEVQRGHDATRLEKEELEFRHALGEFPDEEFQRRAAELGERLDQRQVELAAAEELRERFLAAVRSPEELEHPQPPPDPAAVPAGVPAMPIPLAEDVAGEPVAIEAEAGMGSPADEATPPAPGEDVAATREAAITRDDFGDMTLRPSGGRPMAEDFDSGRTELLDTTGEGLGWSSAPATAPVGEEAWHEAPTGGVRLPPHPPPPPAPAPVAGRGPDEISGATRILRRPRLVERANGDGPREHQLALGRTSIGRASDNLVHLLDEAVSRHHAEIVPAEEGYLLRDLGSENGIYVNGERTGEHVLMEGDVIQIGSRTLIYRSA